MTSPSKNPPAYAISSVDHALRIAAMLQLEGALSVAEVAARLGVARSTAHRLLQMLVYRDFAVQDETRTYHAGPVLELAAHSQSETARIRAAGLPHLRRLVDIFEESANLAIRTGDTVRFIGSVESRQALRVGSREGMVFAAATTTAGLLLLAELPPDELAELYSDADELARLRSELAIVRRNGFAVNHERSERGVVAVGVPLRSRRGEVVAGLSISMPGARYEKSQLPTLVAVLKRAASAIEADLAS